VQELRELGRGEVAVFRLDADDWAILADLRLQALRESPLAFLGDVAIEEGYVEKRWRSELELNIWFLAKVADRAVGIAKLNHNSQRSDGMHLEAMWVASRARKKGVGTCLVLAVEAAAAELGADQMRLWVFKENQSAAEVYLRLGYVKSGRKQPIKVKDRITVETEYEKQLAVT
jgi:GNAT superfamily N-acetyltransferase